MKSLDGTEHTVTVTINGTDDAPLVTNTLADQGLSKGSEFTYSIPNATFTDVDSGDTLTLAASLANGDNLPSWLEFNSSTGTFTGTPPADTPNSLDVKITATDPYSLSTSTNLHLVIDTDGISSAVENAVPVAPNGVVGDGNGDGTPDSLQSNVTSLQTTVVTDSVPTWVTITTDSGTQISNVDVTAAPVDLPTGIMLPFGDFKFDVSSLPTSGSVNSSVYLSGDWAQTSPRIWTDSISGNKINGYWKQGSDSQWTDVSTGVSVSGGKLKIDFTLTDGDIHSDQDGSANGTIVDPGAPGYFNHAATVKVAITAISNDSGSNTSDFITNDTSLTVSGTNDSLLPNEHIQVSYDGAPWHNAAVTGNTWSYTDPTEHNSSLTYQVRVLDAGENIGATASQAVTIDTSKPTAAVAITALADDTGSSSSDFITKDTSLIVSGTHGTLGVGEKVQVSADGSTWNDVTSSDSTKWSYTDSAAHLNGGFTYQARVIDTAGNIDNNVASKAITIDTVAPTYTDISYGLNSLTKSAGASHSTTATITFTESIDPSTFTTADLTISNQVQVSNLVVSGNHATMTVTYAGSNNGDGGGNSGGSINTSGLIAVKDGGYSDIAGNTSVPPLTAAVAITAISSDNGTSGADFITNDTLLTVSGTHGPLQTSSGQKIQVSSDGGATWFDVTSTGNSTWSYTDPNAHTSSFTYQARVADATGNIGNNTSHDVTIDTSISNAAVAIGAISTDSGNSQSDFITNDTSLTVTGTHGTLLSDEKVQISTNNSTWYDVTTSDSTTWSYTDGTNHTANFTYYSRVVDTAGNIGSTSNQLVKIDTQAPTLTISNVATDNIVNATEKAAGISASGTTTAESGQVVTVNWGSTSHQATVANGAWTTSFVSSEVPNDASSTSITANVSDIAGNAAIQASKSVAIDTASPTVSVAITAISTDGGVSGDFVTNDTSLIVSGTHGALGNGEKVQVSTDNSTWYDVTTSDSTTWSYTDGSTYSSGSFTYYARAVDAAGNIGTNQDSHSIIVDTASPTLSSVTPTNTGKIANNATTTVTLKFSEGVYDLVGSDFTVANGTIDNLVITNSADTWTGTFHSTASNGVTIGQSTIKIVSSGSHIGHDLAGNLVTASSKGQGPISLDLDGNGVQYLSASAGVAYDFGDGNGLVSTAWVAPQDGFLAMQKADGSLNIVFSTQAGETDLQGLAKVFDTNHDGVLSAQDTQFASFGVWQDSNSDGVVQACEFKPLNDAGIAGLSLTSNGQISSVANGDITIFGQASYVKLDASSGIAEDICLATAPLLTIIPVDVAATPPTPSPTVDVPVVGVVPDHAPVILA